MPNLPEALLARVADHARAAAIMGDLTELAATRGRLWFWTAYLRTLISIGWRAPVAFLCAYKCANSYWVLAGLRASMHWLSHSVPFAGPMHHDPMATRLQFLVTPLYGLYFLLPFVLVRFGPRDRLTQLSCILFVVTLPTFSNRLLTFAPVDLLAAIVILVALCLRGWRRPLMVMEVCLAPRYALVEALQYSYQPGHRALFGAYHPPISLLVAALTAALCVWLHGKLLRLGPVIA